MCWIIYTTAQNGAQLSAPASVIHTKLEVHLLLSHFVKQLTSTPDHQYSSCILAYECHMLVRLKVVYIDMNVRWEVKYWCKYRGWLATISTHKRQKSIQGYTYLLAALVPDLLASPPFGAADIYRKSSKYNSSLIKNDSQRYEQPRNK